MEGDGGRERLEEEEQMKSRKLQQASKYRYSNCMVDILNAHLLPMYFSAGQCPGACAYVRTYVCMHVPR